MALSIIRRYTLLVISIWAKHVREKFPQVDDRSPDHVERLVSPNVLYKLVSPVAFLLVRLAVRRQRTPSSLE